MVRGKEYKNMQTELKNKLRRILLKLNRAKTEEDIILLYSILHEDITELLQVVFDTLINLERIEHSTLKDKSELIKNHYNLKTLIRDDEEHKLFLESNDIYLDLIETMTEKQMEILDNYDDALLKYYGYQEEQAVLASAERTLTSVKSIFKRKN